MKSRWPPYLSPIQRVDPRARVVAAAAFSVVVAVCQRPAAIALAMMATVASAALAGLRPGEVFRRLVPLNVVMLFFVVTLPLTAGGPAVARLGPLGFSRDGLLLAISIALKGNAIVLVLLSLVGTMDQTRLGHALLHLRVPEKLGHLLLWTVRYLDVLREERDRLGRAMRVRGFRPGMNRHALRAYGYLVGMLLVQSHQRSGRIVAAMKCRGFRGRFYLLEHFAFSRIDVPFALAAAGVVLALVGLEWC